MASEGALANETAEGDKDQTTGDVLKSEDITNEHEQHTEGEHTDVDEGQTETTIEHGEGDELIGEHAQMDEHVEGEYVAGEHVKSEYTEGEQTEGEQTEGEQTEGEERLLGEGEELMVGEHGTEDEGKAETPYQEEVIEEEAYVEEPPPDPAAPYNFSDSQEVLKEPFELRPDQLAEVEQLWELYQNYNPVYTDLDGFITEKELIYMLKCLLLMTYTPEQLQELIAFCVRPPHPQGHITYEQFLKMVTIRQRDLSLEEELRCALCVLDPEKSGIIDREYLREVLSKMGHKMPIKILEHLIKEVDISNDGTIGIEDIVGTMAIDLSKDDIIMLRQTLFPKDKALNEDDEDD